MERVALVHKPIDMDALARPLHRPEAGAVVTFAGTVRAESDGGRTLSALEYHAYEEMALDQMRAIRDKAGGRFEILDAVVVHRLGRVALGETSVAVVVVAAHRPEAFDACRWIIDMVKTDVPIWKKDIWSDGTTTWVDPLASGDPLPSEATSGSPPPPGVGE